MRFQSRLSVQCMQTKQETGPGLSTRSVKEVDLYRGCLKSPDGVDSRSKPLLFQKDI